MNCDYSDIRDKLGEPLWFDEAAVPRYCGFSPDEVHNIYAGEVAFVLIGCQNCGEKFKVAISSWLMDILPLTERIEEGTLYYGDPPNIACCPAGPTMSSESLAVLQFWKRDIGEWYRVPALERSLII